MEDTDTNSIGYLEQQSSEVIIWYEITSVLEKL